VYEYTGTLVHECRAAAAAAYRCTIGRQCGDGASGPAVRLRHSKNIAPVQLFMSHTSITASFGFFVSEQ